MESIAELKRKLGIAEKIALVQNYFDSARCPICGNTGIKVTITVYGAEAYMSGCAAVKCEHCGMFNYERKINGYDAYHWNYNGSSKLNMLRELQNKVRMYLK